MKGLMLHCGAELVSRENLNRLPIPQPTTTHHPIGHGDFVSMVEKGIRMENMEIAETSFGVTADGARFFGLLQMAGPNSEFANVIGLRNSHDKKFPAGLCIGSNVFVCDNLAFSGQINVTRRHTPKIIRHLPMMVLEATAKMGLAFSNNEKRINSYKCIDLTKEAAHDLLVECCENDSVVWSDARKVLKEYREPRHECFKPENLFSFWNAVTEVSKGQPLETLCRRTQTLHATLDNRAGVKFETIDIETL